MQTDNSLHEGELLRTGCVSMFTITPDPIVAHIGPLVLRWYGLILVAAMGIGIWLTAREADRKGIKKDDVYEVAIYIILGGILGARLFHVLDQLSNEFATNPIRVLYVWEGGLAIWSAVAGGLAAAAVICWRRGWRFPVLLDAAAPGLVLAQAIGRIACIITGDAIGKPTNGPFGFAYTSPHALVPQLAVYYTPIPVYEIAANLLIFTVLWRLRNLYKFLPNHRSGPNPIPVPCPVGAAYCDRISGLSQQNRSTTNYRMERMNGRKLLCRTDLQRPGTC